MKEPALPKNEQDRIAALHALCILDTEPEERFDRITRLAQQLFQVPICLISLVDSDRQWFKSKLGLNASESPRDISFCAHAILASDAFIVEDAREDERFADNPFVTGDPHVRFYAGHPLHTLSGARVGTLCLIDRVPRKLNAAQRQSLHDLASVAEDELSHLHLVTVQTELEFAQEELRRFFSLSLDMLCIATFDGYFKKLNPAWSEILGWTLEELYEKPFVAFVHPGDREATIREAEKLTQGHATVSFENRYRCKDGSYRNVLWSSAPDQESKLLYAVARDITQIRQAEEALRTAMRMAEEASQAKSQFLANMSHEFRTPLNSVIGFTNVLLKDKHNKLMETERNFLERIQANGMHLLSLVNDILDLSKIEAGETELAFDTVALDVLIPGILKELEVQARARDNNLVADLPSPLAPIRTDPQRMKQVLINLLGNALKFTEKGLVTVRVTTGAEDSKPTRIDIIDTGIGISPERQGIIFEAFKQADSGHAREYGGTGLGLSISRSLCQLMGYEIQLRSEPGEGTTFSILLNAAN